MPRGRRSATPDLGSLEQELAALKARQSELRAQIRKMKVGGAGIRKLEEKLANQLASAKWTVHLIKQNQPEWDDLGFYQTVTAKPPTPRGRRTRDAA